MKTLPTILTVFFTVMFSSPSYAEWTKVSENSGGTYYVDFERIRKVDGSLYYWGLADALKPINGMYLSIKTYNQGDCKLFRFKILSASLHKEPMGGGDGEKITPKGEDARWQYPPPNSSTEETLKTNCSR